MKFQSYLVFVFISMLFSTGVFSAECQVPSGKTWVNELGSTMIANINSSGVISGTYTTAVGCGAGKSRDLIGQCNGYAITFAVNWQECVSTTAWSGTYDNGKIQTLWQLVLAKKPEWDSIVSGADTFSQK